MCSSYAESYDIKLTNAVITVENLSKRYLVGHQSEQRERYTALRDVMMRGFKGFVRKTVDFTCGREIIQGDKIEEFWALKDVNLEVKEGEVLGIIGRNGAGKTTLLKILSRITEPTAGRITLRGRVASLLEVGTGFHPELTGRENIYLNGAILGMSRAEIRRRFDKIVAFADVEKFLDTPVKRYSSGMYVRLAFAVAAHLDPEVLIVDEVLAVGDLGFQKKCMGRMADVAHSGRTVLFVSHHLAAVRTLTSRCICLDKGSIVASGPTTEVIKNYLGQISTSKETEALSLDNYRVTPHKHSDAIIKSINLRTADKNGRTVPTVPINTELTFEIEFEVYKSVTDMHVSIFLKNSKGDTVVIMVSLDNGRTFSCKPGRHKISAHAELPLAPERYFVEVGLSKLAQPNYDHIRDLPLFEVINSAQVMHWSERPWGVLHCQSIDWDAS